MSDPLSLIRQATMTGTPVSYADGCYIFGEYKFQENMNTFFKRTLKSNDYYYTLKDIIFFLENADATVAEYRRKAVEARLVAIVEQDRQPLKSYLTGAIDICPQIDLTAAANFLKSNANVKASSVTEVPQISLEKMQEQRERHTALLEKTVQKSKGPVNASGDQKVFSEDKLEELRNLRKATKRKHSSSQHADDKGGAGEDGVDQEYIEMDRAILARLRADETPSRTRSTVLCASDMNFASVLKIFNEKILKPAATATTPAPSSAPQSRQQSSSTASSSKPSTSTTAAPTTTSNSSTTGAGAAVSSSTSSCPIIIVPSAVTSCITAINASDFLIDGMYITADAKKQAGVKREREQIFTRPSASMTLTACIHKFKIIDDPTKLSSDDWRRVVAVFATGQTWQFKGWKYSNPVQLFHQVLGVHLTLDDRNVSPVILSWNCKVLKLDAMKQHLNACSSKEFWAHLDDFVRTHKPELLQRSSRAIAASAATAAIR